ncbi:MAG TPA: endoflagellar basal body-associated protein, partial [Spirochaetota bacterium]|nr:endoflagellar basal body-associated protein [Spirochaetota bacterium]
SDNGQMEKELSTRKDEIINICKSVIINKAYKEISSETILDLAEDFKLNINKKLTSGKIKEIFFQEFDVR